MVVMNLTKPIKCIFFDIGGTLNYTANGDWMFPQKAESIINFDGMNYISIHRFNIAYTKCINYLNKNHFVKTIDEEYEHFVVFYTMLADYLPEFELTKETAKILAREKVYSCDNDIFFDDVHSTLNSLSENYKLGIISDSWPSCINKLESANLLDLFNCVTLSCHSGVCKPNAAIYERALKSMEFPAEQTVLIDDSKENLIGAQKCGMQPILVNTQNKKKDDDFPTIHSLSEVLALV